MDEKELPEWYSMAKGFFREIEVFSQSMYEEMNGAGILAQLHYAAEREAAQQSVQRTGCDHSSAKDTDKICPSCQKWIG